MLSLFVSEPLWSSAQSTVAAQSSGSKIPSSTINIPSNMIAGQTYTINGQATGYIWQRDSGNPLELIHWDVNGVNFGDRPMLHPTVMYFPDGYDGYKYYLYYTPYPSETDENPCLMRSNDGVTFTAAGVSNPLFKYNTQPIFDSQNLADPEAVKVGNTWMLFYEMEQTSYSSIGLATSTDGINYIPYGGPYNPAKPTIPWPTNGNPVIHPSFETAYEQDTNPDDNYPRIGEPSVIYKDGVYHMWYTSIKDANSPQLLIYANSTDPTGPWTKYGPVTPEGFFGHSDVVFDSERNLYVMTYLSDNVLMTGRNGQICVATSETPMGPWINNPLNPVFTANGGWEGSSLYRSSLVEVGTQWYLYYSANPGIDGMIGVAREVPGVRRVEISTNGGDSWVQLNVDESGDWNYLWTPSANGTYAVQVRVSDDWMQGSPNESLVNIGTTSSDREWWNSSWQYRKALVLTENSGSTLSNYETNLIVNYVPANMKSDFSDIRFTDIDAVTLLPYWIESYNASSAASVWVRVPLIPANSAKTIYMYYGNPAADAASNGFTTFDFFDDFEYGVGSTGLNSLTKYVNNPTLSLERDNPASAFSSIVKNGSTYCAYMSYHDPETGFWRIGLMTGNDGLAFNEDVAHDPIINVGASGSFDSVMIWCPMVWIEGSTWYMLYSGSNSSTNVYNKIGLATSSDGVSWTKQNGGQPVFNGSGWCANDVEGWGLIKVDSTYYLWFTTLYAGSTSCRQVGLSTSTDLLHWTEDPNNPIFADTPGNYGTYCGFPFKYNNTYYFLVTQAEARLSTGVSRINLYSSPTPTFYVSDRTLLGTAITTGDVSDWDGWNIDTPFVLAENVSRKIPSGGTLNIYYTGERVDSGTLSDFTGLISGLADEVLAEPGRWIFSGHVSVADGVLQAGPDVDSFAFQNSASFPLVSAPYALRSRSLVSATTGSDYSYVGLANSQKTNYALAPHSSESYLT